MKKNYKKGLIGFCLLFSHLVAVVLGCVLADSSYKEVGKNYGKIEAKFEIYEKLKPHSVACRQWGGMTEKEEILYVKTSAIYANKDGELCAY